MVVTKELREEITGAIARGYCSDVNANKVLDSDLCMAMVDEVLEVLKDSIEGTFTPNDPAAMGRLD